MVCAIFNPQASAKGVRIVWKIVDPIFLFYETEQKLPWVRGDERRFLQCLINLVKNAIKFTNSGSIELIARYDWSKSMLKVEVKDTGVGLDPADVPHLF